VLYIFVGEKQTKHCIVGIPKPVCFVVCLHFYFFLFFFFFSLEMFLVVNYFFLFFIILFYYLLLFFFFFFIDRLVCGDHPTTCAPCWGWVRAPLTRRWNAHLMSGGSRKKNTWFKNTYIFLGRNMFILYCILKSLFLWY
jgi:hypothetical protein